MSKAKNEIMKDLLFPTFVRNSIQNEEINYDMLYSNARLDLLLYITLLENEGLTKNEIIQKLTTYNKSKHLNKLDENTKNNLIKNAVKSLKK